MLNSFKYRALVVGLCVVLLQGCSVRVVHDDTTLDASRELLRRCTSVGIPKVGSTNDSLVHAFLEAKAGVALCQGVANAVINSRVDPEGNQ